MNVLVRRSVLAISEQYAQLLFKVPRKTTFDCFHFVLYVADSVDSSWSSLVEGPAVEALHAMVSHDTYCQKLLESDMGHSHTFQEVLSALVQPSAQLTFGACLARLATHHWDLAANKARESTAQAKESVLRGGTETGSRLVPPDVLIMICSRIQEAVLVGFLFIHRVSSPHTAFLSARCTAYF